MLCVEVQIIFIFILRASVPDVPMLTLATSFPFFPLQCILTPSQFPMPQVCELICINHVLVTIVYEHVRIQVEGKFRNRIRY